MHRAPASNLINEPMAVDCMLVTPKHADQFRRLTWPLRELLNYAGSPKNSLGPLLS